MLCLTLLPWVCAEDRTMILTSTIYNGTTINETYDDSGLLDIISSIGNWSDEKVNYFTKLQSISYFVNRSNWATIDNYPSGCGVGEYVSGIGDTLTCSVPSGSGGNPFDQELNTTSNVVFSNVNVSGNVFIGNNPYGEDSVRLYVYDENTTNSKSGVFSMVENGTGVNSIGSIGVRGITSKLGIIMAGLYAQTNIDNSYGLYAVNLIKSNTIGVYLNGFDNYDFYGSSSIAKNYFAGNTSIGTLNLGHKLMVNGSGYFYGSVFENGVLLSSLYNDSALVSSVGNWSADKVLYNNVSNDWANDSASFYPLSTNPKNYLNTSSSLITGFYTNITALQKETIIVQSVDVGTTNNTIWNNTEMSFSIGGGTNYYLECNVLSTGGATTTGIVLNVSGAFGTTGTNIISFETWSSETAKVPLSTTSFNGALTGTGSAGSTTLVPSRLIAYFTSTSGGTLLIKSRSEVALSASTFKKGSKCSLRII
jgi:hypothetical protein